MADGGAHATEHSGSEHVFPDFIESRWARGTMATVGPDGADVYPPVMEIARRVREDAERRSSAALPE